jgi:transposase-like protein
MANRYTPEQKAAAVNQYINTKASADTVARKHKVGKSTLYKWVQVHYNSKTAQGTSNVATPQITSDFPKFMKMHVISSLQSGRSIFEVAKAHNITTDQVRSIIDDLHEGKLDQVPSNSTSTQIPSNPTSATQPDVITTKVVDPSKLGTLLTALLSNGMDFDEASALVKIVA